MCDKSSRFYFAVLLPLMAVIASEFRASGLVFHLLSTTLVFWMCVLAFPSLPRMTGFVTALVFLMNRTALVSSTFITQHAVFTLLAGTTLFLMAQFCRNLDVRFWYASMAALGIAFSTVETSFVLAGAVVATFLVAVREKGLRRTVILLFQGLAAFAAGMVLVWPKGLLQLGFLKGY